MKKKKILVWAYTVKNLGDDLFLKVLFDKYKNVDWYLLHARQEYKNIFEEYNNVYTLPYTRNRIYKYTKQFIHVEKYDALLYIGGSMYMQIPVWESQYNDRKYLLKKFKSKNKKIFTIGANFGPYKNDEFVEKYRDLFREYDDVCFRDAFSLNLFNDLKNIRLAPDAVFQLDVKKYKIKPDNEKKVGFSIIDISKRKQLRDYEESYNKKLKELVEKYIYNGYKVSMFSFCDYEGDLNAINKIINMVDHKYRDNIEIINYDGNINRFLNEFSTMSTIIGTRFHSIILSQTFGQCVYPLIYSEKTVNTLKYIGLSDYYSYIEDIVNLDVDKVFEVSLSNKLSDNNIIEDAKYQFLKFDEFISDLK